MKPAELVELSDRQLDNVAGGMTKIVDAASPTLFQLCPRASTLGPESFTNRRCLIVS
jgi:hypothetical protein